MLNLEWFRTFKAIYDTGTLSAAAIVLKISQPGVSLHLNSLESYAGYRLFERETRRMMPTDRGIMLYNFLTDPINKLERAEEIFDKNSQFDKPTLSIGMTFDAFVYGLEAHVSTFPFNLIVRFADHQQMLHDLDTGALDLVVTDQKGAQGTLEYHRITTQNEVLVCGSETPIEELSGLIEGGNKDLIKGWLKMQRWYATGGEMTLLKKFWAANFGGSPDFKPNIIMPYFSSVLHCLSGGEGFAVVPEYLCREALLAKQIRKAWAEEALIQDDIFLVKRAKTLYPEEIEQIQTLLIQRWKT